MYTTTFGTPSTPAPTGQPLGLLSPAHGQPSGSHPIEKGPSHVRWLALPSMKDMRVEHQPPTFVTYPFEDENTVYVQFEKSRGTEICELYAAPRMVSDLRPPYEGGHGSSTLKQSTVT